MPSWVWGDPSSYRIRSRKSHLGHDSVPDRHYLDPRLVVDRRDRDDHDHDHVAVQQMSATLLALECSNRQPTLN